MQIFDYDDGSYLTWLVVHPNGFAVNSYRQPNSNYLILHRSECKSISRTALEPIRWTTSDFIKVCSDNRPELERWAREIGRGSMQSCGRCHPIHENQESSFSNITGHSQSTPIAREHTMQFAISIPQFVSDGAFDPDGFRTYMRRAEELGFVSAWTQEQLLGSKPSIDPLTAMTYAAACTERIRLGCAVFVLPLHSPVHLAKSLSTLDQVSRGRVEVGVGSGGRQRAFTAFGIAPDNVGARFTEAIRVMQACWTGSPIAHDGEIWQIEGGEMEPKPFQKPYPPLWFGAHKTVSLRRAVQMGDGFFGAGSSTTAQFAQEVITLREILEQAGRDPASFPIAKRVYIGVDDDAERVRHRVVTTLDELYGPRRIGSVAVAGTPAECIEGLREVAAAGAGLIMLNPLFDDLAQMERLTSEVIPAPWPAIAQPRSPVR